MKLILFAALLLCTIHDFTHFSVSCNDVEDATLVTEEDPTVKVVEAEEIIYSSPVPKGPVYFAEHFDIPDEFEAKWVRSQAKKDEADDDIAKYDGKFNHV
jgi:calnexin